VFVAANASEGFPVCWLVFTLVRGSIVDLYPYPFVDAINRRSAHVPDNGVWESGPVGCGAGPD